MKFYQKRGFALVVLVLAILGSCVYGISKKPADLPQVSYGNWLQDDADLLTDETEASLRQYDQSWDSDYRAIIAVATLDTLNGWTYEKAAAELGSQWGLGGNDMLLLLVKDSDYYVALGDNVLDAMTDTYQAGLQGAVEAPYYQGDYDAAALAFFRQADVFYAQRHHHAGAGTARAHKFHPLRTLFCSTTAARRTFRRQKMTPETNALIPVGIAALCFLLAFLYGRHRRALALRRRVAESFGQTPAEPERPRAMTREFWELLRAGEPAGQCIDDATWNDLDMDDVFARIDICQSAVGRACLYAVLHRLNTGPELARRARLCGLFAARPALRLNVQLCLARLGRKRGQEFAGFLFDPSPMRLPLAGLYRICMFLPFLALPSLFFGPWALCFLAACVLNTALYYHAKDKIRAHLDTLGYFSMLLSAAKRLSRLVQADAPQLSDALNDAARPLKAVSGGVGALARPSTGELNDMLFELMGALTLAPLLYYDRAVRVMQREHAALLRLCMLLGETELAIAALSFRESLPLRCTPEFTSEMALVCDELYHPLLETPVANSAVFRRHTLFTGSNASGKSTFIKALAVNAILAQTLGVCAARAFTLPRALAVSSMAVSDNLCAGDSYFVAELKSLRRLLACAQTGTPCLCFIDEILKGTNTVERIAASAAVLRHLAGCRCLCFVATHDRELTEMLAGLYENRHFSEQVGPEGVTFDYLLREGPAHTRNAIALLAQLGFPAKVTQAAEDAARAFEAEGRWPAERSGRKDNCGTCFPETPCSWDKAAKK